MRAQGLRSAIARRAEVMSAAAHGVARPARKKEHVGNASDARFVGGNPVSWAWSGCSPSRFRDRPVWPPPEGWPNRSQIELTAEQPVESAERPG